MDKITLTRQQLTDWATSHRGNGKLFTKKVTFMRFVVMSQVYEKKYRFL